MEEYVIKDYQAYLEEQEKEHSEEMMKEYISGLYYDLLDNIDIDRQNFGVPKDIVENWEAIDYIEEEIEKIIVNYYKGE